MCIRNITPFQWLRSQQEQVEDRSHGVDAVLFSACQTAWAVWSDQQCSAYTQAMQCTVHTNYNITSHHSYRQTTSCIFQAIAIYQLFSTRPTLGSTVCNRLLLNTWINTDIIIYHRFMLNLFYIVAHSVAEWLACRTQARKSTGSNCSRDVVE